MHRGYPTDVRVEADVWVDVVVQWWCVRVLSASPCLAWVLYYMELTGASSWRALVNLPEPYRRVGALLRPFP